MARLLAITLLAVALLGCGQSNSGAPSGKTTTQAALNGSDQSFIREMIPHHRGAIAMARVAVVKSQDPRVKTLAERIVTGQEKEVTQMRAYRLAPLPADQMQMDHHHAMEAGPLLKSKNFDRDFLRAMIAHHQSAIPMSQSEVRDGQNKALKMLAAQIILAQQKEIAQMQDWLKEIERKSVNEPTLSPTTQGKPSATKQSAKNKPLRAFNLGTLLLNQKNPEALMTTTVDEADKGNYGVEVVNAGKASYDIIVAIRSGGQTKLVEETIKPGQSRLMSADFHFKGTESRDFTIKAAIKNR